MKYLLLIHFLLTMPLGFAKSDRIFIKIEDNKEQIIESLKKLSLKKAKFAISGRVLEISTTGKKNPKHDELALNGNIITGGYIQINLVDELIQRMEIDNYSGRLCPSYLSLFNIVDFLQPLITKGTKITFHNNPNIEKCPTK